MGIPKYNPAPCPDRSQALGVPAPLELLGALLPQKSQLRASKQASFPPGNIWL